MQTISNTVDIVPWKKPYKDIITKAVIYKKEFCYGIKDICRAILYTYAWWYRVLYYNGYFYAEVYNYDWYIQLQLIDFKKSRDFYLKTI